MIRLGLRLAVAGGREAAVRLVVIAAAVALGAGLLLATLAGINAVNAQNAALRLAQHRRRRGPTAARPRRRPAVVAAARGLLPTASSIGRVDVAATGPDAPVPPGIPALPGPGEFYASPALHDLLRATPADRARRPLPGPRGRHDRRRRAARRPTPCSSSSAAAAARASPAAPAPRRSPAILTTAPSRLQPAACVGIDADGSPSSLSVVAAALLFPVLIFIGTATRLVGGPPRAAVRRDAADRRDAPAGLGARHRRVDASPRSPARSLGFGAVLRAPRRRSPAIPFTGARVLPRRPVAEPASTSLAVARRRPGRRGGRGPARAAPGADLAAGRHAAGSRPRPPRAWRLIPLVAGVAELAYFARPATRRPPTARRCAYLPGLLLDHGRPGRRRAVADHGRRPAPGPARQPPGRAHRRAAGWPTTRRPAFRAVSGARPRAVRDHRARSAPSPRSSLNRAARRAARRPPTLVAAVRSTWPTEAEPSPAGATSPAEAAPRSPASTASPIHPTSPPDGDPATPVGRRRWSPAPTWRRHPALRPLPAGREVASIEPRSAAASSTARPPMPTTVWPASTVTPTSSPRLPVLAWSSSTDGSAAAIERARTLLEHGLPARTGRPSTHGEFRARTSADTLDQLAAAGQRGHPGQPADRRLQPRGQRRRRPHRPQAAVQPAAADRRAAARCCAAVVALESAVPLLLSPRWPIGSRASWPPHLFLRAQLDYDAAARPAPGYYADRRSAGWSPRSAIIASTLPLLRRITGPETARNE